ncbi:MAG TPA: LysR family transcriptional regulator [Ideonella sp.]|uniref:LysR family transcriptional regulator n=1 Tax=Ideonella sp. TaxID=1929293 RepID=UPI002BAA2599|nr:LysR family transcriptional regulator [Ideonella sp.]HSI47194.1 LysR family transcriptional regulator [Ideonella sp.]
MNFDLSDLRAFLAVADFGSLRAASDNLHLSQSALSRRIDKLEAALGVKLFSRTTRKVELTMIGRTFVPKARSVMRELQDALVGIQDASERISGQVALACVPSAVGYFLPTAIRQFHAQYPRVRMRLIDEATADVLLAVARGDADFGVTYIGSQEPDIDFQPLLKESFVVACSVGHRLAKYKRIKWKELADDDYITLAQGSGNRFLIDQALSQAPVGPRWFCEVRHVPALVSLVEAGLGIGVVPRLAMPPRGHSTLVSIPLEEPEVTRTIGLIKRRGRELVPAAQLFYDMLLDGAVGQQTKVAGKPGARGVPRKHPPRAAE